MQLQIGADPGCGAELESPLRNATQEATYRAGRTTQWTNHMVFTKSYLTDILGADTMFEYKQIKQLDVLLLWCFEACWAARETWWGLSLGGEFLANTWPSHSKSLGPKMDWDGQDVDARGQRPALASDVACFLCTQTSCCIVWLMFFCFSSFRVAGQWQSKCLVIGSAECSAFAECNRWGRANQYKFCRCSVDPFGLGLDDGCFSVSLWTRNLELMPLMPLLTC